MSSMSINELMEKAMNNDAEAQDALGCAYVNGEEVSQDMYEAAKWFRKSADLNSDNGMYHYACFLENGWGGVRQNYQLAYELYVEAGNAGIADAQNNAGMLLCNGSLGNPKYAEAAEWFKKAAAQGNQNAINNLNELKREGLIIDTDDIKIEIGFDFSDLLKK